MIRTLLPMYVLSLMAHCWASSVRAAAAASNLWWQMLWKLCEAGLSHSVQTLPRSSALQSVHGVSLV